MRVSGLRVSRGLRIQTLPGKVRCILSGSECSIITIMIIAIIDAKMAIKSSSNNNNNSNVSL